MNKNPHDILDLQKAHTFSLDTFKDIINLCIDATIETVDQKVFETKVQSGEVFSFDEQ
jgi:hypothetical protein